MGNCVIKLDNVTATVIEYDNKQVIRQISTPDTLSSQTTEVIDEYEWSLIQYAHRKCKEGDEALHEGNLEVALGNYKAMLHVPKRITNSKTARLYIQQIAMGSAAKVHMLQENYNDATQLYELAMDIAIELEDKKGEAIILLQLSTINKNLKRYRKAAKQCKRAIQIFRELGDRSRNEGIALVNQGYILRELGNVELSDDCFKKGKDILRGKGSGEEQTVPDDHSSMPQEINLLLC